MTARQRMSRRKPPPLDPDDCARVTRLHAVATDAIGQLRHLMAGNQLALDLLDEVTRLQELVGVQVAAEAEVAQENERKSA